MKPLIKVTRAIRKPRTTVKRLMAVFDRFRITKKASALVSQSESLLKYQHYDYIVIVPWIIAGGADKFAINYANYGKRLRSDWKVLVITTEGAKPSCDVRQLGLNTDVDFLAMAELVPYNQNHEAIISRALQQIVFNKKPRAVHIILSKLGYEFIEKNGDELKTMNTKIILTGFNNSITNSDGKLIGYAVNEIPRCYKYANIITTDNLITKERWVKLFNFSADKIVVHNNPFDVPSLEPHKNHVGINVLWAAHIRTEKNPELVVDVAKQLFDYNVRFDCYGELDINNYPKNPFTQYKLPNLKYMGAYKDFFHDIDLPNYDLFMYTTMSDGMPNILIEAGLANLPIITSRVGGIPEMIRNDGTLISDYTVPDQFINTIKLFMKDRRVFTKKAASLRKHLIHYYGYKHFEEQISDMLATLDL